MSGKDKWIPYKKGDKVPLGQYLVLRTCWDTTSITYDVDTFDETGWDIDYKAEHGKIFKEIHVVAYRELPPYSKEDFSL